MIFVPFIYFSLLSLLIYRRRRGIDMALVISLIYAAMGFFAIFNDALGLRYDDVLDYVISPRATVAYCGLLTLCLVPFIANSNLSITSLKPVRYEMVLRATAWVAALWFVVTFAMRFRPMISVLTGDMNEHREALYVGDVEESWMETLPSIIRVPIAIANSIFGCSWTLIFLAFYSLYVQKMPLRYFLMFMMASLSAPVDGVLMADRSVTTYWIMSFAAMYLLFRNYMTKAEKVKMIVAGLSIVGVLATYLVALTVARFSYRDYGEVSGTEGGVISYLGQGFVHFCYFYDNYEPPFMHLGVVFPFTVQYFFGIPTGAVLIQQTMTELTGIFTGVFYTFIGHIIIGAGKEVAIAYCVVYAITGFVALRMICRKHEASALQMCVYFAYSSVMLLGPFTHYYTSARKTAGLVIVLLLLLIAGKKS